MANSVGAETFPGVPIFRCLAVGLTAEQEAGCRDAIAPIDVVRAADVDEACTAMSTVLPLVVVFPEELTAERHTELADFATACGAELVRFADTLGAKPFGTRLLDALRVAELRRFG